MTDKSSSVKALTFLSVSLFLLSTLPKFLCSGMFFDGATYASISRNLAEGRGTFWSPYYTDTTYPVFHEQPPLFFLLQAIPFRLFGNSVHVEASWGIATGLLLLLLIWVIWTSDRAESEAPAGGWAPVLLFATIPMAWWIFSNNMLEGTMVVFSTLAALLAIQSLRSSRRASISLLAVGSGLVTLAAVLVKGPVGLFPLGVPILWCVAIDRRRVGNALFVAALMLAGLLGAFLLLIAIDTRALPSLSQYFSQQFVASVSGARGKAGSHFGILRVVAREVVVPFVVGVVAWGAARSWGRRAAVPNVGSRFWFYLLIGLSGSLPVAISPKQMMWYVFPSFPFYCLAIAALFEGSFGAIEDACSTTVLRRRVVWVVGGAVLLGALSWMIVAKGTVLRGKAFHHDFVAQRLSIPERAILSVYPPEMARDWVLVAYMQRQFKASLSDSIGHEYLLVKVDQQTYVDSLHAYERVHPPNPTGYVLYIKRDLPALP